jgi:phosphoribosylanthranilate isomerase
VFIKVCGITTVTQIEWAVELGYSAIGIVLHPASARYCDTDRARKLAGYARGKIASVAVGVSYDEVSALRHVFDYSQAYEYRDLDGYIYAGDAEPPAGDRPLFMYDTSRGAGKSAALPSWLHAFRERLIISGGLGPENVSRVISEYRPFGVDVSSGVEAVRGMKDYGLMNQFIAEVRHASR